MRPGSVALHVVAHACCPIAVIRDTSAPDAEAELGA
jgi:hypothetical protein